MEMKTGFRLESMLVTDNRLPTLLGDYPPEQRVYEGLEGVLAGRTVPVDSRRAASAAGYP